MNRFGIMACGSLALLAATSGTAAAQTSQPSRPAVLSSLIACRSITEAEARLACFDTRLAALDQAERQRDVVIVDRSQIRKARRTLFGLQLPDFSLFGDGKADQKDGEEEEGVSRIESTIAQASQGPTGRWTLTLPDGARWLQIDTRELASLPRAGMPIVIRRATMGSFLASLDKQIAIRVRRIN